MRKYGLIFLMVIAAGACAKEPKTHGELARHGPQKIAIDGYSPISYFAKGIAEKGSPDHTLSYDGLEYWLADASQVEQFEADPKRYVPAHGGWCSLMLSGSGNLAAANPESFKIVDNRLLLFWSGEFNGQAIDGLRNWESKFSDASGEKKLLKKSDRTWNKLLSGAKSESVVFFSPEDAARVNATRRETGKKMYK